MRVLLMGGPSAGMVVEASGRKPVVMLSDPAPPELGEPYALATWDASVEWYVMDEDGPRYAGFAATPHQVYFTPERRFREQWGLDLELRVRHDFAVERAWVSPNGWGRTDAPPAESRLRRAWRWWLSQLALVGARSWW